ncbi:MAG: hypothetical protein CL745_03770 [Chloroflexi bacterium]|nr:hypothetical protein [Chloroflexota bacterium]
MKKIFFILPLVFVILFACGDETKIFEPKVTADSLEYSFTSKENGKFVAIYRNQTNKTIPITFAMAKQREIMEDSQNYDFCPDIINFRKGTVSPDWFVVNLNLPIVPENSVLNRNDHPNLVSYKLPQGTYIGFVMDAEGCNDDQFDVFDITSNDALNN